MTTTYPKRLIEVDLPIKRISAHARREKSIRHGHISTLHIWWARRPLAACRAVICAALWPDPADPLCPQAFRDAAAQALNEFGSEVNHGRVPAKALENDVNKWRMLESQPLDPKDENHHKAMRGLLLDFIAAFSAWESSTEPAYLATSRKLTQAVHEALGGEKGTRPLVVDPFAGGGSIPLEALRVGADAFASDLNPVAVLLNKVVLEYIPKYGNAEIQMKNAEGKEVTFHGLAQAVRYWGEWIKKEAEKELAEFYPKDPDGATPIAYLWARTIQCEGPNCGAEVPLMRSLWLAKNGKRSKALKLIPHPKENRVDFGILDNPKASEVAEGTVARGSATCPCCGYTTPVASVRAQLKPRRGGAADARMFCVVTTRPAEKGRFYRLPDESDLDAARKAITEIRSRKEEHTGELSLVPNEPLPPPGTLGFRVQRYGMEQWGDLFTPRQALVLTTLVRLVGRAGTAVWDAGHEGFAEALQSILACAVDREAEHSCSLSRWNSSGQKMQAVFGRQALPIVWDACETNPFGGSVGSWENILECVLIPFETAQSLPSQGISDRFPAAQSPLPDDSAHAFITDPPYYDAVPYADLSDFFYVWLRRTLLGVHPSLLADSLAPKSDECIVDEIKGKDYTYFGNEMNRVMREGRRVLAPEGIGLVVFAHKTTSGWEAQLQAMIEAGWTFTGSWPIDTEMGTRLRAMNSAALASSIHLVCRPRENADGSLREEIGDWRDVLAELPKRIHDWMPRLADEGVVGADAIFACLGPALEIFSRYSSVEKASGEEVTLKEYLEHVWAAVAKEALNMIFAEADATGYEEDARLTAMWFWTLSTDKDEVGRMNDDGEDEEEGSGKGVGKGGYTLEFDAARKIAQGLGAHLEQLTSLVEVKGDKARLLPVSERARHLFGKSEGKVAAKKRGKPKRKDEDQELLFDVVAEAEEGGGSGSDRTTPSLGKTSLDRIHQSMLLFAAGRGEALKRFLVEDGAGADQRFWSLAQSLSALYPHGSDEKRWVDGVLARKKSLGF